MRKKTSRFVSYARLVPSLLCPSNHTRNHQPQPPRLLQDICAIGGSPFGMRAVLKFSSHVGASSMAGRYTPGTFTNQARFIPDVI
jgi:hypothetical protein